MQSPLVDRGDCSLFQFQKLQPFIQVVVQIIPAQFFLEFLHAGILVNAIFLIFKPAAESSEVAMAAADD